MNLYYNTSLTNYAKRDNVHNVQGMTVQLNGINMYSVDASWTELSVTLELNHHPDLVARATQNPTNGMSTNGRRDYTDNNHAYSSGGGIKYNYCAVHPEHDLTERYDWDGIWAAAAQNRPNLANYYYSDVGVVDMNDSVNGGWRTLIATGKMVEEQSPSFGNDFEGCDCDVFSQLAR
ncbi:hypothetical protein OXX59_003821 [Metschnikowia pulcherrima]